MNVMPLFHVHGLIACTLAPLWSGGSVILPPRFSASTFWTDAQKLGATWTSAVPTIFTILLQRADSPPTGSLRFIRSCSAALAPAVQRQLEERFGCPVVEALGMSENAHQVCAAPIESPRQPGSVGPASSNVQIAVFDSNGQQLPWAECGEICVRGWSVFDGYIGVAPSVNESSFWPSTDGTSLKWFRTGDQGWVDENGWLHLTARIKELINRGGEKIMPGEVDAILLEHPDVAEALAFGVADDKYGEEVAAAVVLKADAKTTADELRAHVTSRIAAFKVPKRIYFLDALPRTATGKLQRRSVAEACQSIKFQ